MGSLKRLVCAFRGHQDYLHFEKDRVYLECVSCGYESPGWTIGKGRGALTLTPSVRFPTARRARALIRKAA
jgi:hypothetical protein